MKKIILLSAKMEHGKDSFSDMVTEILEEKGLRVGKTHFARHMKQLLIDFYGAETLDGTYNTIIKTPEMRTKLQTMGTEKIRIGMRKPMFHVKRTCEDIDIIQDDFDIIIISDCRFSDEADYTKAYFPKKVIDVRIVRVGHIPKNATKEQLNHPSEVDLDDYNFSYVIRTESGLKELRMKAEKFVEEVLHEETI